MSASTKDQSRQGGRFADCNISKEKNALAVFKRPGYSFNGLIRCGACGGG